MEDDEKEEDDREWAPLGWLLTSIALCLIALIAAGTIMLIHRMMEVW